jgi:cyclopropane-fatty-acyl-phospholipid synthase
MKFETPAGAGSVDWKLDSVSRESAVETGNGHSPTAPAMRTSSRFERWLLRSVLQACGDPAVRVVLWDGESISTSRETPVGTLIIRDRGTLRRMALQPIVGFGDGYSSGRIDVEGNLVEVLCMMSRAVDRVRPNGLISRMMNRRPNNRRSHTLTASRDSVHHHYDIGNNFYKLWLDEQLLYTCAYYPDRGMTLEQAQIAKMDHVCRKLQLRSGERVIEAGCGWGALALHMARKYGVSVRAFNLSREQIAHAKEWARSSGLAAKVEFIEDDYRNAAGTCDAFVSVGMLEHVGLECYPELGRVIDRVLSPVGRGLIHTIGRNAPAPLDPWIDKRIFPGAYPPALSEMMRIFEPTRLSVLDVENIRLHYARTLEQWLERYDRSADRISRMFDERFVRTWRLYLAGSVAAFVVGCLQLFQVVFARETNNDISWTRAHQYLPQNDRFAAT